MQPSRRALVLEAMIMLAAARLALTVLPFRTIARGLGEVGPPGQPPRGVSRDGDSEWANAVSWAVRTAARNVPFKAVCLPQGIAAKTMLRLRGVQSALHFGVAPGAPPAKALKAHAWLEAAGARVTGYPVADRFTEIACFR